MANVAFIESPRFPEHISQGSRGGPSFRTEVVEKASGAEERNTPWARVRHQYDAKYGVRTLDEADQVRHLFHVARGRLTAFRFKDWSDYRTGMPSRSHRADDQTIGVADGLTTVWQLKKTYVFGGRTHERLIQKPRRDGFRLSVGGNEWMAGWTLDDTTGLVTFAVPPVADAGKIMWGGEFDTPVRFDSDMLDVTLQGPVEDIPSIPLIEVRL